jgi:hypothetical protein
VARRISIATRSCRPFRSNTPTIGTIKMIGNMSARLSVKN